MRKDNPSPADKKTPWHKKWWITAICFLGGVYLASFATSYVLQERIEKRLNAPVSVMYKWTDEKGIVHYSDKKQDPSAEMTIYVKDRPAEEEKIANIETKALFILRTAKPILEKLLAAFVIIAVVAQVLKGIGSSLKRMKQKRAKKRLEAGFEDCILHFKNFSSELSVKADKSRHAKDLAGVRTVLDNIMKNPDALDDRHREVISMLRRALETYIDCITLWDIKAHSEITTADNKVYLMKYPTLLDKTAGDDKPLSHREFQSALRKTLWMYASRYINQAETIFSKLPDKEI
jgi:hypothetical protein